MHGGTSLLASMLQKSPEADVLIEEKKLLTTPDKFIKADVAHLKQNRVLVNKICLPHYPAYTLEHMFNMYQNPGIVYIFRDFRDTVLSCLDRGGQGIHWGIFWCRQLCASYKYFKDTHPDKTMYVKYENLIREPGKELDKICTFLGCSYTPDMLNFDMVHPGFKKDYGNAICKDNAYKYKNDPRKELVESIFTQTKDVLREFGYET